MRMSIQSCRASRAHVACLVAAALLPLPALRASNAAEVCWADWTTKQNGAPGFVSGSMAGQRGPIAVDYTGEVSFAQVAGGTNYWVPSTPYVSDYVSNPPPTPDIVALIGTYAGTNTIAFSEPVTDPVLAVVSLGRPALAVKYLFDAPFEVLSSGNGYWGGGAFVKEGSSTLVGNEGHGAIRFTGTFAAISWTVSNPENWHGFTVGRLCVPLCDGDADLDGDGAVTGTDLGLLLADWPVGSLNADINCDGVVDGADLGLLLGQWTG